MRRKYVFIGDKPTRKKMLRELHLIQMQIVELVSLIVEDESASGKTKQKTIEMYLHMNYLIVRLEYHIKLHSFDNHLFFYLTYPMKKLKRNAKKIRRKIFN